MLLTDLAIAIFATWQIIEIWRHGSLFLSVRACLEECHSSFADFLLCPFCLSPWVACGVLLLLSIAHLLQSDILWLCVCSFAVSRVANLLNDVFYSLTRTPKNKLSEESFSAQEAPKNSL